MSKHQATHHRSNAPKNPDQDEAIGARLTCGQAVISRCPAGHGSVIVEGHFASFHTVTCIHCGRRMVPLAPREAAAHAHAA